MDTLKYLKIGVIASLIIAIIALFTPSLPTPGTLNNGVAGTAGNMLAEQYIPYVQYNGGYNSAKDFSISGSSAFSGATSFTSTLTTGTNGTAVNRVNTGTCYIMPTATTIAASSSVDVDCQATQAVGAPNTAETALAGVTSGDNVIAILATSSSAINSATVANGGLTITGSSASTTSGYIRLRLWNGFGGTYTYPTTAVGGVNASGTVYYYVSK